MSPILGIWASAQQSAAVTAFESIATVTVGAGGASSVTFSSIPSTYTHLQIRGIARDTSTNGSLSMQFNSDTGNNYARHNMYGTGSGVFASASSSTSAVSIGYMALSSDGSGIFGSTVVDILNYANTSKYKTTRSLSGVDTNGTGEINLRSGLWLSTSAVTSISIGIFGGTNIAQYSQFALYGIKGN